MRFAKNCDDNCRKPARERFSQASAEEAPGESAPVGIEVLSWQLCRSGVESLGNLNTWLGFDCMRADFIDVSFSF